MSPHVKRLEVLEEARKSLAERLQAAGIVVPDQAKVRQMMEAIRLGLKPEATQRRIDKAWFRRAFWRSSMIWTLYDFDSFVKGEHDDHQLRDKQSVPQIIQDEVRRIREVEPSARIDILALRDDPWPRVTLGKESLFLRGWMGDKILSP